MKSEKIVKNIKKEIEKLEYKIENKDIQNKKIELLKKLKTSVLVTRALAPYSISIILVYNFLRSIDQTPFYRDDVKIYMKEKKYFDSYNNIRYEQQYEEFENTLPILKYYNEWTKVNDNEYKRSVEIYNLKKIKKKTINKLVEENDINKVKDLLYEPIQVQTEVKNNITEQELNTKPYLQAIIYNENKKEYTFIKQQSDKEFMNIFTFILLSLIGEIPTSLYRTYKSKFNFKESLNEIKNMDNIEVLQKKLEIKKDNYNRLKRKIWEI